jgi:hypothetical protein
MLTLFGFVFNFICGFLSGYGEEKRKRRLQIKSRPMFSETSDKNNHRASLLEKRQRMMLPSGANALTTIFTKNSEDLVIRRKTHSDLKDMECSVNETENTVDVTTGENLTCNCISKTNLESTLNKNECRKSECLELKNESREEKMNRPLEDSTEKVIIPKLNQDEKRLECDTQLDVNSETSLKPPAVPAMSNHQKAKEDGDKTSNVNSSNILLEEDDFQSKRRKISLVSEMYSDTDSDSSK